MVQLHICKLKHADCITYLLILYIT